MGEKAIKNINIELLRSYLASQTFEQKLNQRLERLQKAEQDPVERVSILLDCANDPVTFISLFGVVYEPRLSESPDIPFFPFDYQRDILYKLLSCEERGEDLLIDKTRDMGATWIIIWYILWRWLFKERWYCLMGSRKEEEVDNKSPNSLFGKLRYGFYTLPHWVRPPEFKKSEHDIFMKLLNPQKMSFVDGESANPNFARGKRASMIFMDELFFWKFVRESWRSSSDASPVRIAVSTAKPTSFARHLRDSFEEQGKLITLRWQQHPFKDEEWYKKELARRESDPLSVEAELEIKYTADPTLAYYIEAQSCPIEEIPYNPMSPLYLGLDFGSQDKTAIVYFQRDATSFTVLDGYEKRNKPLAWYYPFLKQGYDFAKQETYEVVNKFTKEKFVLKRSDYLSNELELIKRFNSWKMPVMYCGEPAHNARMFKSNTSIGQELAGIGIFLRVNNMAIAHAQRRAATKSMLMRTKFSSLYGALDVHDALVSSQYVSGHDNSSSGERVDKPVHDEFADIRSAVENFAVNIINEHARVREFVYKRI
jgi:hypothetical protein